MFAFCKNILFELEEWEINMKFKLKNLRFAFFCEKWVILPYSEWYGSGHFINSKGGSVWPPPPDYPDILGPAHIGFIWIKDKKNVNEKFVK